MNCTYVPWSISIDRLSWAWPPSINQLSLNCVLIKTVMQRPGIEPGPPAWQASILPLNQRCLLLKEGLLLDFYLIIYFKRVVHFFLAQGENIDYLAWRKWKVTLVFVFSLLVKTVLGQQALWSKCIKLLFVNEHGPMV